MPKISPKKQIEVTDYVKSRRNAIQNIAKSGELIPKLRLIYTTLQKAREESINNYKSFLTNINEDALLIPPAIRQKYNISKITLSQLSSKMREVFQTYQNQRALQSSQHSLVKTLDLKLADCQRIVSDVELTFVITSCNVRLVDSWVSLFDYTAKFGKVLPPEVRLELSLGYQTILKKGKKITNVQTFYRLDNDWMLFQGDDFDLKPVSTTVAYMHYPSKSKFLDDIVKNLV